MMMEKTLIVWRRLGKEHGEGRGFQVNDPDVIRQHLQEKVDRFRQAPAESWRWWQQGEAFLFELPESPDSPMRYYYLPERHIVVIHNNEWMTEEWPWYIHLGDIHYNDALGCWVFTDYFVDVIVAPDHRTHTVLDLDDLALAMQIGLITPELAGAILSDTQQVINSIREDAFPPSEIVAFQFVR